ncbi:MAG: hypothetical protein KAJ88_03420 [Candidatus Aenigmarchaeota archaeon]|nr:hypothetical protein [Candidatus Aenigmarchaeota archaeon]
MDFMTTILLISFVSFILTYLFIPKYIKKAKETGIVGIDKYKTEKKEVAESGGITILFGYLSALFLILNFFPEYTVQIFAVATTALLVAFIGMIDDFYNISWRTKTLLPLLAAPPLMVIKAGVTSMYMPFIGQVDFGLIYTIILIPLAITGAANAVNMVAGYNGLEAGLGVLMFSALTIIGFITGNIIVILLSTPLVFVLLAFLYFNKYPAKIFPGDSGTFMIGIMLAVVVILGNIELIGVILIIPHIFNLIIYYYGYFKRGAEKTRSERFGSVDKQGYLVVPNRFFLPWLIASFQKTTEKRAIYSLYLIELVFVLIAIFFFLL